MSIGKFNETSESKEVNEAPKTSEVKEATDTKESRDDFDGKIDKSEKNKESKGDGGEDIGEKSGEGKTSFMDKIKSLFSKKEAGNESEENTDKSKESKETPTKDTFEINREKLRAKWREGAPSLEEQAEQARNRKIEKKNNTENNSDGQRVRERTLFDEEGR